MSNETEGQLSANPYEPAWQDTLKTNCLNLDALVESDVTEDLLSVDSLKLD